MANIFPKWSNWLPLQIAICLAILGAIVVLAVPYYFTPKYTREGYTPTQPVPFDHSLHVQQVGLDCRYCHSNVELSSHSNIPTSQVCANCHSPELGKIGLENPNLDGVRHSIATGDPIRWVRVHALPDYVYFNHAVHVNRGVSCVSCHGKVNEMKVVSHAEPHSMGWCLDCHRNPEEHLRPLDQVFNLDFDAQSDVSRDKFYAEMLQRGTDPSEILSAIRGEDQVEVPEEVAGIDQQLAFLLEEARDSFGENFAQEEMGLQLKKHWQISPPESCAACHR